MAARELGCEPEALVSEGRRIFIEAAPHVGMDFAEAARRCFSADGPLVGTGCYEPPSSLGGDFKGATVGTSPAFSFGSSVCELEVDPETGVVKIIRFTDAHDSGTVLNPIANAICDAVGVRMTELPITPQKILKALEEKESSD